MLLFSGSLVRQSLWFTWRALETRASQSSSQLPEASHLFSSSSAGVADEDIWTWTHFYDPSNNAVVASNLDHPDVSPPGCAEKVCKLIAAPNPWLTPHHQSERWKTFSKMGKSITRSQGEKLHAPQEINVIMLTKISKSCQQPGCYQGIGGILCSSRLPPPLSKPLQQYQRRRS